MDLDPVQLFNVLHKYLDDEKDGPHKCIQLLGNLNEVLTQEHLYLQDLDLFLHHFFNKSVGLPEFVLKIINKKEFKKCVVKILELIYALLNNFPSQLEKYVTEVCDLCFKIIKSSLVSSEEKVKSLEVLILCFEKINKSIDMPEYYKSMYSSLVKTLSIKKCDSVQEKIYIALGSFGKHFSHLVMNEQIILRNIFLNGLETQMTQKEFSNRTVCGVFTGLVYFCESFSLDTNKKEDQVIIGKIHKYIDKLLVPKGTVKIGNRAALQFLAHNISLFVSLMIEKYQYWHESLLKWLHLGSDDQKTGVLVVDAYYRGLGEFLMNDGALKYKHVTMYFYEYLMKNLSSSDISNMEKRLCLQGLSAFSGVYQLHLNDEEIKSLLCLLIQNFEQTFVVTQDPSNDVLEYLPSYMQTVTKFVHFRKITNTELFCLQKSAVMMIKIFPQLPYSCHSAAVEALISTFYFLLVSDVNDEKLCDNFIENVVYQGVVWTCSHRHISEADILETDAKVVTVRSYFSLWRGLLNFLHSRKLDKHGIYFNDRKYILVKITDKLIRTMLILINKLNVSVLLNNAIDAATEIQVAYKVAEANDFAIFLNMVDFYEEVLGQMDPDMLKKCICKLIQHLIAKCIKYSVISGFYKLLSFCLKISNKISYLQESSDPSQDVTSCVLTLTKFVEILLSKTQQFKGDLLIACLEVLLEYPICIVGKMLPACVPSFKIVFQVGRTYIKLAFVALNTLERWQTTVSPKEIDPFLLEIIPLLDCYLQSKHLGEFIGGNVVENKRKTVQALKKRKIIVDSESQLTKLQMRIVKFIGQQSNSLCEALAFSQEDIALAVWGNQQHLKITLPYEDSKLDIYLDKLLPRIVNVALNCTDRKTRVLACEVLQASVMIFLGRTKQMSKSGLSDLNELLRYVVTPLLRLGCDMDQVIEQLFRPLCLQLIHWYTHSTQSRNEHSAIIIEAILEGITHPNDSALRDFCGKCVNEFIKWTIKQSNEQTMAKDPINIKILLKKMRFYSNHPDPFKKLGAALIFNNIYRGIREESFILSTFWIEFLHVFVKSLSTYETETKDDNTILQINRALDHIERGFVEKASLFNNSDKDRRIPIDLKGGLLKHVAVWLLEQSGSKSPYCRAKCMDLFCSITPHTKGFKTLRNFIDSDYATVDWIRKTYSSYLIEYPTLESLSGAESTGPISWMQALLCALDGYIFVIKEKLTTDESMLSTTIISAINYFVDKVSAVTLDGACAMIQARKWTFTDFEKDIFDKQRSQAVVKILQLFNVSKQDLNVFYGDGLWTLTTNAFFNQQVLGFDEYLYQNGTTEIIPQLKEFLASLPENRLQELVAILEAYVASNLESDFSLKSYTTLKQRSILNGLNTLQSFDLNQISFRKFSEGMIELLLNKLFDVDSEVMYVNGLQDTTLNFCLLVLNFALENIEEFMTFVDYLYKPYQIKSEDEKEAVNFGFYLLTLFEDSVIPKLVNYFETFLNRSFQKYEAVDLTVEFISCIVNYVTSKRQFKYESEVIVRSILVKWDVFEKHFSATSSNISCGLKFLNSLLPLMKFYKFNYDVLKKWLVGLLKREQDLTQKQEVDVKIEVFRLLVNFSDVSDDESVPLRNGLIHLNNELFAQIFSLPLETRTVILNKLLSVVPKIKTPELLVFLLDIYAKNFASDIVDLKNLLKSYILTTQEIQRKSLCKIYDLYTKDGFDDLQRYKLITETVVLFQACTASVLEEFLVSKIADMVSVLKQPTNRTNVLNKILQFSLIEILFSKFPIRSSDAEVSSITLAAVPGAAKNKSFILLMLKCTLDAFKDSVENSQDVEELFRLYKCHAYNAMISIVSNSLKDDNFYTKLFIRQENNTDILWHSIVDTNKMYVFSTDFETIPNRRKILVNIRDEIRANRNLQTSQIQSVRYISSVRVYNSSLSEDLTKFDFTNNIIRSQAEDEVGNRSEAESEVELDCTDVNNHECMANVCALIEHLVNTQVTPLPTEDDHDYKLPVWINGIRTLLLNPETHVNVKIFWVKVVDNMIHIFKHFAKWFLEPLMKFLVDRCAGTCINYFLTDVVAILATWSTEVVPSTESETNLASEVLGFLIDNLNNERQDMFKYHLELIRLLVEAWKSVIRVPYDYIYSKLNVDPTSKKVVVGIHLTSIFLANKILPWKSSSTEFCKTLFNIVMKSTSKTVYKPCAETIGLVLRASVHDASFDKIFRNFHVLLKKIEDNHEKHALVLEAVVLHYPQIADEYHLRVLLSRIDGVLKQLKVIYLRIILSRSTELSTIEDFKTERWDSYVEYENLEVQLLALEIVYKCFDILKDSPHLKSIVESLCKLVTHSSVLCRSKMFDIAILICHKQKVITDIVHLCSKVLVEGLTDSDFEIREKIYTFWKNNSVLSTQISKRFAYIFTSMYQTNIENEFLGYSSYLLLDTIKKTEEYNNVLFEHPLEDCNFEEYKLQTHWRARHLSIVPLFAETIRSVSEDTQIFNTDGNKLRQTQTLREFAPTQSIRMKQFSQLTTSESSLYIKSDDDAPFVDPNLVPISQKYRIPKRRFLRDRSKIMSHFAQREVTKSIQKVQHRQDLAKEQENKVVIYRTYRKGDLPDIQITLKAILDPLQALTLYDGEISRILYSEIFQCVWQKMKSDSNFTNQIATGIKTIFTGSNQFNRSLFRTLFDILLFCKSSLIFPADLVVTVSQSSGLKVLGVLLLEEYLISHDEQPSDSKRMRGLENDVEFNSWIKLAGLYKEMDEWDVVRSVFLNKVDSNECVKNAIIAESRKQWKNAQDLYKSLIESESSLEAKDFYYESYFKCLAHLGEWNNLVDSIDSTVSQTGNNCWNDLWDESFNQQKLMPWYISGQLKKTLFSQNSSAQFFTDLNNSLNSNGLEYLESHFCEEIAMLWIFKNESAEAEKYVKTYLNNFLDQWQQLDYLYANTRYSKLLKLRNVIDIHKYLLVNNNLNIATEAKVKDLIMYWKTSAGDSLPSIILSEERLLYRRQFIRLLADKITSCKAEELEEILDELNEVKFKLDQSFMDAAIAQNNFYMTKKYLTGFSKQNILKQKLALSQLAYIKSTMMDDASQKFEVLFQGCKTAEQIFQDTDQAFLKVLTSLTLFNQLGEISKICHNDAEIFENKKTGLASFLVSKNIVSVNEIALSGADKLKMSLLEYENESDVDMESNDLKYNAEHVTIADAYVQLAYFAKNQDQQHFTDFMIFVLKAMKFNSSEGRQLFPCIIMANQFSDQEMSHFLEETQNIPVWMFLAWIPQILVNIDTPKVSALAPLVLRIAEMYPQAIMYAYRLSKESYKSENADSKLVIEKLDQLLLSDMLVDKFLKALSFIGVPAAILLYYVRKMFKLCQAKDIEQLKTLNDALTNELFDCKPDSRDINSLQGNMFKKIFDKYKKELNNIKTLLKRSNGVAALTTLLKKIDNELVNTLRDRREIDKYSGLLKDYSPWLANFSAYKVNFDLEIPGQYDGNKMPLPKHHVKISGFCPNVTVMTSLRKPIKITVLGNDTKQYSFLVKFGEDVRQDQRIQQLFTLMNNIFGNDKNFNGRKFSIMTYQVVPLTTSLGIIQWIDNTTSLQEFVKKSMKNSKSSKSFDDLFEIYQKWIYKSSNCSALDAYGRAALNYSRDKTIVKFKSLTAFIDWDVLRSQFHKLSANTESFFVLRNNFIVSYAVMCVSHWIVGVGDRHLSNSLICLQSGKVLGIDFGHAFGTATQILPVPELVPFRLTPHLVGLMEPLGEKGLFREIMIHCLKSLKNNSSSLLFTMKVFIEEPSLDWLEHASRFTGSGNPIDALWYPAEKVNQAERKLHGANSKNIVIEDLRVGHRKNESYMKAYIKLVEGCPEYDFRATKGDNLSVEDQVDCLIDHATDYNLLGRMFEGWAAWV